MEHESDCYTNCNWCTRYNHRMNDKGTGGLGNKRTSGDHLNDSIINIGSNTNKNPGDLKGHDDTQTLVEKHQLMLG